VTVEAEVHLESLRGGASPPATLDPGRTGQAYGGAVAAVLEWLDEAATARGVRPLRDFVEPYDREHGARVWHDPASALPTITALLAHVEAEDEGAVIRPGPHYLHSAGREALLWDLRCYRSILEEAASRGDRFVIVLC
jgi:hypothetical protein